jgi:hypothetical protein
LTGISQSLAGRVGILDPLPLSIGELSAGPLPLPELDDLLLAGGYPAIHAHGFGPGDWMAAYVATCLERDMRQILNVQDLAAFQPCARLCAGRTGQLLNLSAPGGEVGVAHSTARAWLGILEASYLVHLLPPYHRNFGKGCAFQRTIEQSPIGDLSRVFVRPEGQIQGMRGEQRVGLAEPVGTIAEEKGPPLTPIMGSAKSMSRPEYAHKLILRVRWNGKTP